MDMKTSSVRSNIRSTALAVARRRRLDEIST